MESFSFGKEREREIRGLLNRITSIGDAELLKATHSILMKVGK